MKNSPPVLEETFPVYIARLEHPSVTPVAQLFSG